MKKILNNKIDVKLVLPVSEVEDGLMLTLSNSFVLHGGKLKEYGEDENEETLVFETNEIVYHLIKKFINSAYDYTEIEVNGVMVLRLESNMYRV